MYFALGAPGQNARLIWQASAIEQANAQLLAGEVAVEVPSVGAYLLSADGLTASAVEPSMEDLWRDVRARRQGLLTACDWTQFPDVPEATRAAWVAYRQALRDITETYATPAVVVWPQAPAGGE